ncbi:Putative transposase, IS66-like [Aromatoleum bremense]|nr:Putative transposase, IS66-like [Aromatoleum bremense]
MIDWHLFKFQSTPHQQTALAVRLADQFHPLQTAQFESQGLLPNSPLTTAMAYVRERRAGRPRGADRHQPPSGARPARDADGASQLALLLDRGRRQIRGHRAEPLIATCRLHNIDPYTYLVDVLQRVGQHPATEVAHLTPRLWKQSFVANPLRSDLFAISK